MRGVGPLRRLLAAAAALAALCLIALDAWPLADIFQRADPTLQGSFSLLHLRAFLSVAGHLALAALALRLALGAAPPAVRTARSGAWLCFGALGLELLALAPCLFGGGALCGVFYLVVGPLTALAMLAGFAIFVAAAGSRAMRRGALLGAAALGAAAVAAFWLVTPRSPADCAGLADGLKRDACTMNFALQTSDERLCEQVVFDSSRWSCLYQIAERKGDATLCERIAAPCRHTTPGPACEPDRFRDTCWLVTSRKLREPALCERMTSGDLQASCRKQAAAPAPSR